MGHYEKLIISTVDLQKRENLKVLGAFNGRSKYIYDSESRRASSSSNLGPNVLSQYFTDQVQQLGYDYVLQTC